MNLTLKIGNLTLADGTWTVGVVTGELPKEVRRLVDTAAGIGATGPTHYDRVTRTVSVDFTITRTHGSPEAALAFWAQHDDVATGVGTLTIDATTDGDGVRLVMTGAKWEALSCDPIGTSTDVRYRVEGGPFVVTTLGAGPTAEVEHVRDGLLSGESYGPLPGVVLFPAPWSGGIHNAAAVTSVNLAAMAS